MDVFLCVMVGLLVVGMHGVVNWDHDDANDNVQVGVDVIPDSRRRAGQRDIRLSITSVTWSGCPGQGQSVWDGSKNGAYNGAEGSWLT